MTKEHHTYELQAYSSPYPASVPAQCESCNRRSIENPKLTFHSLLIVQVDVNRDTPPITWWAGAVPGSKLVQALFISMLSGEVEILNWHRMLCLDCRDTMMTTYKFVVHRLDNLEEPK